jgi:hypothetical protein
MSTFYINGSTFLTATTVYTDSGLNTVAPDGFYKFNGTIRQQLNGTLLPVEPCQPCEFIFIITVEEEGFPPLFIQLPLIETGDYDFIVDWGDGNQGRVTSWGDTDKEHTYDAAGTYIITITGKVDPFTLDTRVEAPIYQSILQWGCVRLTEASFRDVVNLSLTAVTDTPHLTGITSLESLFRDATSLTTINNLFAWDMTGVENINNMFDGATGFISDVSAWELDSIISMTEMFNGATAFNQNLGAMKLGTSLVNADGMFANSGLIDENYTDTIVGWANQVFENGDAPSNVSMTGQTSMAFDGTRGGGANFASAAAARTYLTTTANWTISEI